MSIYNNSESITKLEDVIVTKVEDDQNHPSISTGTIFTTAPLNPPADVLICGSCSSQFSDLKLFIDHKQNCGNSNSTLIGNTSNNVESAHTIQDISTDSSLTAQHIILPASASGSLVNLPIGMPHVLLQTPSGTSQMYRIVLEPSLNGAQINIPTQTSTAGANTTTAILDPIHYQLETTGSSIVSSKADTVTSTDKLSTVNTVEQSWVSDPMVFNSVSKTDLHTEETDVATFLATQLANQSAPHYTKNIDLSGGHVSEGQIPANLNVVRLQDKPERIDGYQKFSLLEPHIKIMSTESPTQPTSTSNVLSNQLSGQLKQYKRQKIICDYENCAYQTFYQKDMQRHVRKHTGEKPFPCTECGSKFSRQDKLKVHMRIHKNERPYACKVPGCFYSGIEKAHLNKHMRTHTDERPYKCQVCPYAARDGSQLTVHLRSHTGDTPFHCQNDGCPAAFKTSSDLRRHERLHSGEKPFKCTECDYATALKSNLKVHFRINHYKTVRFCCGVCPFTGTTKRQLKEHQKTHPDLPQQQPSQHIDKDEGENLTEPPVRRSHCYIKQKNRSKPTCVKNFRCEHCGCGFVRDDSYRSHIRQHLKSKNNKSSDNFVNVVLQTQVNDGLVTHSNEFSSYIFSVDGNSHLYTSGNTGTESIRDSIQNSSTTTVNSSSTQETIIDKFEK